MTAGVRQIVSLNWPFYAIGSATVALAIPAIAWIPAAMPVRAALSSAITLAAFWIVASVAASWIVYDASGLMRWRWIGQTIGVAPRSWINIHAGLDQSTPGLRNLFPAASVRALDIFDPAEMTEPSILRARRLAQNEIEAEPADFRRLPVAAGSVDVVTMLLSAHELRTADARHALFAEVHRALSSDGCVIVAEHLRNWPNFAAFGPGFLHFHSRSTWKRCFTCAGFVVDAEFPVTPFVRVFVLRRSR